MCNYRPTYVFLEQSCSYFTLWKKSGVQKLAFITSVVDNSTVLSLHMMYLNPLYDLTVIYM